MTVCVPWPPVMVPLLVVHNNVPVAVVVAVLPVELAQTDVGEGVMSGVAGLLLMVTLVLLLAEQLEPLVTFRLTVAVPLAPAVYVID